MVFEKKTEHRKRHDIFVTYLGGPGKSGSWVANQFRAVNQIVKTNLIEFSTVVKIAEKNQVVFDDMKVLIIADDFACTGNSLCEYLEINKNSLSTMATEFNVRILLFVAFGFEDALDSIIKKIEDLNLKVDVHFGKQFGEEERIFSGKSRYFSSEDKKRDMEVILVEHFGHKVDKSRPKGYNDSEVAIVFPEKCPNNSLPVFWKSKADWTPLFRRIVG